MIGSIEGARSGLASVTRGTLVMMLGTLGFVAESFISRVLLVRTLLPIDPDLWSEFSLALALAGLISAFGSLGLGPAIARSLPFETSEPERRRIVHTAVVVGVPAAVGVTAGLAVFSRVVATTFHSPLFGETLLFFAVAVGLSLFAGILAAVFQGFEDVFPAAFYNQVLSPALFIAFLVGAVVLTPRGDTYLAILAGYVAASVLSFTALVLYVRRRLPGHLPPGPREPGVSRKLLVFAAPLFLVGILTYVTTNGDTLILGALDRGDVGYYTAELSLARLLQVGIGSLAYIFLPVTSRLIRRGDRSAVRITFATATKWMVLTSLPLFFVFAFFPDRSVTFVYGGGFPPVAFSLGLLVVGAFLSTLVGPAAMALVAYGRTRLLFYNTAVCATLDLALGVALIPHFGLTGAALSWACANALYPALSLAELAALEGVHPFERHYVVPLLATALPLAGLPALVPFSPPFWALPALAVAIGALFTGAVVVTGSIDAGDQLLLEAVERVLGRRLPLVRRLGAVGGRRRGRRG